MVDASAFNAYAGASNAAADMAQRAWEQATNGLDLRTALVSASELEAIYKRIVEQCGYYAAQAAIEYYEAQRAAQAVASAYAVTAAEGASNGLLAYDVMSYLLSPSWGLNIGAKAAQRTLERGDSTLFANAQTDPAHPKWAIIPHAGACDWCKMLGSRGFDYRSGQTASAQRHSNCKCSVAVDFDTKNPKLEGYDPVSYLEAYQRHPEWSSRSGGKSGTRKKASYGGAVEQLGGYIKQAGSFEELQNAIDIIQRNSIMLDGYGTQGAAQLARMASAKAASL